MSKDGWLVALPTEESNKGGKKGLSRREVSEERSQEPTCDFGS
jgi:hypothetical protein